MNRYSLFLIAAMLLVGSNVGIGFLFWALGACLTIFICYVTYSYVMVCCAAFVNALLSIVAAAPAIKDKSVELTYLVEGSVPGANGGYVVITRAKNPPRERRGFAGAATVDPLKAAKRAAKKG